MIRSRSSESETDQTDRKTEERTEVRTGTGTVGIDTKETTSETEIKTFNVPETWTKIETGTVTTTKTDNKR